MTASVRPYGNVLYGSAWWDNHRWYLESTVFGSERLEGLCWIFDDDE